ncbi:hypothetical protein [Mangrovicoccus algicola]|uniref:Uncharacterized protein n=1 Tax=Mangrovicoccus algicola TaxID=2771008 RepID=A0A8J6YVM1_9RHOB|nr:hypothetical protein [Mangrovicoccus algicola]MBE3636893.1 hypothetical protein [Mangrovicoccus algicola]
MIRLILYAALLGLGAYAGAEYQKYQAIDACLDAGGRADARGFCRGMN